MKHIHYLCLNPSSLPAGKSKQMKDDKVFFPVEGKGDSGNGAASSSCLRSTGHDLRQCVWCWLGGKQGKLQLEEDSRSAARVQKNTNLCLLWLYFPAGSKSCSDMFRSRPGFNIFPCDLHLNVQFRPLIKIKNLKKNSFDKELEKYVI